MTKSPPAGLLGSQKPQIQLLPAGSPDRESAREGIELLESVGFHLDPFQLLPVEVSLWERPDGTHSASSIGHVVPRQNGKGDAIEARELLGVLLLGEKLIIHTAHEVPTAKEAFLRMQIRLEHPALSKFVKYFRHGNGDESVHFVNGARILYRTRTARAGRGFAKADLIILDEAFSLTAEQLAAIMPTLAASPDPQLWFASSGGMSDSTQLWAMRIRALKKELGRFAYFEHTAENLVWNGAKNRVESTPIDVTDRRLWAMANPTLGNRITWDYVEDEFAMMQAAPEQFARERLGVFDPLPVSEVTAKVPYEHWEATVISRAEAERLASRRPMTLAFDVDLNAESASIALATGTLDSSYVEVFEHHRTAGWLARRLVELVQRHNPIAVGYNAAGPANDVASQILVAFREAGISADLLHPLGAGDYASACGAFYMETVEGRLKHLEDGQDPLDLAVEKAGGRPLGERWAWDRRGSGVAVSPLVAVTVARSLLPEEEERPIFAY